MPVDSAAMLRGGGAINSVESSNMCFNIHLGKGVGLGLCRLGSWGETSA